MTRRLYFITAQVASKTPPLLPYLHANAIVGEVGAQTRTYARALAGGESTLQ